MPDMYDYRDIDCEWFCLQPDRFGTKQIFIEYPLDDKYLAGVRAIYSALYAPIGWTIYVITTILDFIDEWTQWP